MWNSDNVLFWKHLVCFLPKSSLSTPLARDALKYIVWARNKAPPVLLSPIVFECWWIFEALTMCNRSLTFREGSVLVVSAYAFNVQSIFADLVGWNRRDEFLKPSSDFIIWCILLEVMLKVLNLLWCENKLFQSEMISLKGKNKSLIYFKHIMMNLFFK